MSVPSPEMQEFADGVAFWRNRQKWPEDFHNADYEKWTEENPNGDFNLTWWYGFLRKLQAWIATRPFSGDALTSLFTEHAMALRAAWQEACVPHLGGDISTVVWDKIKAFPNEVAKIKPTRVPSPVFTSKFCHFLLPKVFPVVDNEGLGNGWPTYKAYFEFVQEEWQSTGSATRAQLVAEMTTLIEATGQEVYSGFPMTNKIIELRLIGRHRRTATAPTGEVNIRLSHDEALILFEWLHRSGDEGSLSPLEHPGEQVALRNLSSLLGRELVDPIQPNYHELIERARDRLAGTGVDEG